MALIPTTPSDCMAADTTIAGSASPITNLPADEWRPEVWELSPDETSVLTSAPVRVAGQRYERVSTLALTPGAQPHVIVPQLQWLDQYSFIDAGRFVLYGNGSAIYRVCIWRRWDSPRSPPRSGR